MLFLASCERNQSNENELQEVFPPQQITNVALFRINNLPVTQPFFQNRWTLVAFADSACGSECLQRLNKMIDVDDTQSLLFFSGLADHAGLNDLANQFRQTAITLGTTSESAKNFYKQFNVDFIAPESKQNYIYLISPQSELTHVVSQDSLNPSQLEQLLAQMR